MDLSSTFGPWYNFARLFGYFPAYSLSDNCKRWEATAGVIMTLMLSLGNIGLHSLIWVSPMRSNFFTTAIGSGIEVTFNIVDSVVPVITILLNLLFFGHVKKLFGSLSETEMLLGEIHVRLEYRQQQWYTRIVLLLVLTMQLLPPALIPFALLSFPHLMDLVPITLYMTYRQLSNLSYLGSVMMVLLAVFMRFKSINVCLFGNFLRNPSSIVGISLQEPRKDPLAVIAVLSKVHQILCESVDQINLAFSFQVGP